MSKPISYYKAKLLTLRNVIDHLLEEMGTEQDPTLPRKRRNLKTQRVEEVTNGIITGKFFNHHMKNLNKHRSIQRKAK